MSGSGALPWRAGFCINTGYSLWIRVHLGVQHQANYYDKESESEQTS
jgi:hypothetical protein